jgi:murein DD-endopeptidase MepM/ murein hydrolase activator NlpD
MKNPFNVDFHPVIALDKNYQVLDFSSETSRMQNPTHHITIGRYNERRPFLYHQKLFEKNRIYHMGIDLGAPEGTAVHACYDGSIYAIADHSSPGDYGPTIITQHQIKTTTLYALHGHLSKTSLIDKYIGQRFNKGDIIAHIGNESENGGWPPHVHFQLSYRTPLTADMPGVVSESDLSEALAIYPDPRIVLGPIY